MSQSGVVSWSKTAANNATADSNVNWAEGQAPSTVNNSARAEMASVAEYRDDTAGSLLTDGTSTAYTITTNQNFLTLTVLNGQKLKLRFHATNGAAPTIATDSLTAKAITVDGTVAVGTGVIKANSIWDVTYDNSLGVYILNGVPAAIQDGTVVTASIPASAVTYAKIQNVTDQKILGNFTGSAAAPSEIGLVGPSYSGAVLTFPFPPPSSFKNLSILVAGNATVAVAADFVTMTDGSAYISKAIAGTLSFATSGAINRLDTGTVAANTWYYVWAIYNPTSGLSASLASLSSSSPTMPTGYTYKARIGALRTAAAGNLMGTYQYGRKAQYVVGLAQTSILPVIDNGATGVFSGSTPTLISPGITNFIPTVVANTINVLATNCWKISASFASVLVAPSSSYGGTNNGPGGSNGMVFPIYIDSVSPSSRAAWLTTEANTIAWCSSVAGGAIACLGWEDNL